MNAGQVGVTVAALGLLISVASLATASVRARISDVVAVAQRLTALEQHSTPDRLAERLSAIETKVDVFWRGLSLDAARVLHSPHPQFARRDALLEAFMSGEITAPEVAELSSMLTQVVDDHTVEAGQRMAAAIVLKYLHTEYAIVSGGAIDL